MAAKAQAKTRTANHRSVSPGAIQASARRKMKARASMHTLLIRQMQGNLQELKEKAKAKMENKNDPAPLNHGAEKAMVGERVPTRHEARQLLILNCCAKII